MCHFDISATQIKKNTHGLNCSQFIPFYKKIAYHVNQTGNGLEESDIL